MSPAQISEHEPHTTLPKPAQPSRVTEPEEPKGSPFRKWIVILVILAIVGAAAWKIHSNATEQKVTNGRQAAAGDRPVPVMVATVDQRTMPIYLNALGTVTAYNTVTVKSRVDGQLIQVAVREGQAVRKGQLLAQIDPSPYAAALAQAEGTLVKDQAMAANARAEAQRYTALADAGVVSKESQQSQVASAGQAEGSIASDQAAIEAAKVNLEYTKITSPIDGVVGLRQVDPGNIVHASDTTGLLVVTQLQPIAVIFTLPEDQLPQVVALSKGGRSLAVEAYDRSNTTHLASGKLLTLDNQIDTTTGTVKVKAVFDNKDESLFPNQFVNIRLILQDRPDSLVVPAAAIQTGSQGNYVFLVKEGMPPVDASGGGNAGGGAGGGRRRNGGAGGGGGRAGATAGADAAAQDAAPARPYFVVAQPVKVDLTEGAQVIVASGVSKGDMVVIDGQEKLKNNARVLPRDQNAPLGGGGNGGGRGQRNRSGNGAGPGQGQGGNGSGNPGAGRRQGGNNGGSSNGTGGA
jgi:membrane fusion protein, multidrug efflux system